MAVDVSQVEAPDGEEVELWFDPDEAMAVGIDPANPAAVVYDITAALKLDGEDEVDPGAMTPIRLTMDRQTSQFFLAEGALEELEASAGAVSVSDGAEGGLDQPQVIAEQPQVTLEEYISELWERTGKKFDGWVYDYYNRDQYLAHQEKPLKIVSAGDRSNMQGSPAPKWTAERVTLARDDGVALPEEYTGYFEVVLGNSPEEDYLYLFLSSQDFEQARTTLAAQAPAVQQAGAGTSAGQALSEAQAIANLTTALSGDRAQLFWRESQQLAAGFDIVVDADAIALGNMLSGSGEQGWELTLPAQIWREGWDDYEKMEIEGCKLLVGADNQMWIQIPDEELDALLEDDEV